MGGPELLLLMLMLAVGGLSVLAGAVRVPYPIVLVLGGLALGFVPGMPPAELPPDLVLVHLPAAAAVRGGVLRQPARPARRRAANLPAGGRAGAVHHVAVAAVAHAADRRGCPGRPRSRWGRSCRPPTRWPPPPSPAGWACPRRIGPVIEGESLVNDAHRAGRLPLRGGRRRRRKLLAVGGGPALRGRRGRRRAVGLAVGVAGGRRRAGAWTTPGGDHDLAVDRLRRLLPGRAAWACRACWPRSPRASTWAGARPSSPRRGRACRATAVWEVWSSCSTRCCSC